jgi:acetyl-CoA C-acetyltransferase
MTGACAVIGVGQTRYAAARSDVTLGGLVREAAQGALDDAGIGWRGVDAVVLGKAPDMLEGVMSPELYLADALGAVGKPVHRAYTSGSAGGVAASIGVGLVSSGLHARVLVVCFEKQSEARAAGATLQPLPFEAPWHRQPLQRGVPRVHRAFRRPGRHRRPGGAEGTAQRRAQPVCPDPQARADRGGHRELEDALGSDPPAAFIPILGRGVRRGPGR